MRWTPAEVAYIREYAPFTTAARMAQALGRTRNAVLVKMFKMGIAGGGRPFDDSARERREYVRARAGIMNDQQIARALGLSPGTGAVAKMRQTLGVPKGEAYHRKHKHATWYGTIQVKWTPDEYRRLEEIKKARAGVKDAPAYVAHDFAAQMGWVVGRSETAPVEESA